MEMMEKIENINGWYGRREELVEDLEDMGLEVLESNAECIVVAFQEGGEDVQIQITLGGTESTIVISDVEEIYRG